jgi:hypothetical protein
MEIAGKYGDHYFRRCQENIKTTIFICFGKKMGKNAKRKLATLHSLSRQISDRFRQGGIKV